VREDRASQMAPAFVAGLLPDFRLLHPQADEDRQNRGESAEEKEWPPTPAVEQEVIAKRCQQKAHGVPLLQESGEQPAQPRRHLLHGQRRAHAPLPTHPDAKQAPQDQEGGVVGRQTGKYLDDRIEHQVDHQRQAAAVAVGQQAE